MTAPGDVVALLYTRSYLTFLVFAAILGVLVAAFAYRFLYLVGELQKWLYQPVYLPKWLGFDGTPNWWAIPLVAAGGRGDLS